MLETIKCLEDLVIKLKDDHQFEIAMDLVSKCKDNDYNEKSTSHLKDIYDKLPIENQLEIIKEVWKTWDEGFRKFPGRISINHHQFLNEEKDVPKALLEAIIQKDPQYLSHFNRYEQIPTDTSLENYKKHLSNDIGDGGTEYRSINSIFKGFDFITRMEVIKLHLGYWDKNSRFLYLKKTYSPNENVKLILDQKKELGFTNLVRVETENEKYCRVVYKISKRNLEHYGGLDRVICLEDGKLLIHCLETPDENLKKTF